MGLTNRKRHEPIVDALPEFFPYRDEGCEVAPSCLRCPLSQCKYDDPLAYHRSVRTERDRSILKMIQQEGVPPGGIAELARRFDLSIRTVHRILARGRAEPRAPVEGVRNSKAHDKEEPPW